MSIKNIPYCPPTASLKPEASVLDALRLMLDKQINHVPLCDDSGGFAGIVSTNQILHELIPASARVEHGLDNLSFAGDALGMLIGRLRDLERRPAAAVANRNVPVLSEDTPILEAALLLTQSTAPLPIVSADGRLLGMLSRRILLTFLAQIAES